MYEEEQSAITDDFGMVHFTIGSKDVSGKLKEIDWTDGEFQLQVEYRCDGGGYQLLSSNPLLPGIGGGPGQLTVGQPLVGSGTPADPIRLGQNGATEGDVLKWNGTRWAPALDEKSEGLTEATVFSGDVQGAYNDLQLVPRAVGTTELQEGAVTTAQLANGAVTGAKIARDGATSGQVLRWSGSKWEPANVQGTQGPAGPAGPQGPQGEQGPAGAKYTAGIGISISGSNVISNTGLLSGSSAGGDLTGSYPNPAIANNAVTTAKIANGAVTASKLDRIGANQGQALTWNGSAWAPATADVGFNLPYSGSTNSSSAALQVSNSQGNALVGIATGTTTNYGVTGETDSPTGRGVIGRAKSASGVNYGVAGTTASPQGFGLFGHATSTTGTNIGARGIADGQEGRGVSGIARHSTGGNFGVFGTSESTNGRGVAGVANAGTGVNYGVQGRSNSNNGNAAGIFGQAPNGALAGLFHGNVRIVGRLDVTGCISGGTCLGARSADDPDAKSLIHAAINRTYHLTVQNGNALTDDSGLASVDLPADFARANSDFRYQLTAIGEFAQVIVRGEIEHNRFVIQTDKPNIKVSWQVTGVMKNIEVEVNTAVLE